MPIKYAGSGLLFILITIATSGQVIGFDPIDDSKVNPWIPKEASAYEYVYHFGASEMESDLVLFHGGDKYHAQIKSFEYSEDAQRWFASYSNLSNIRIEGNKFYSDQTNGEFVLYDNGDEKIKGLKVYTPWSGMTEEGEYEIGTRDYHINKYFLGKYPQASRRVLSKLELLKMNKSELKIMRNEIFARYGYQFTEGGEMDTYFRKQSWYFSSSSNVNDCLTELEKANIELIRSVEKK